jgi:hypothetical protein
MGGALPLLLLHVFIGWAGKTFYSDESEGAVFFNEMHTLSLITFAEIPLYLSSIDRYFI